MAVRILKLLRVAENALLLLLFFMVYIAVVQDTLQWADNQIVQYTPIVASPKIKRAMQYHGITYCTCIDNDNCTFVRNGKIYNLFDFKMFPKLKLIIERMEVK